MVAKAKTKKQDDTMVEFRVAMTSTCTHKGPQRATLPLQGVDRRVQTVGAISGPNWSPPLVPFTTRGFTWSEKSTLDKQTS